MEMVILTPIKGDGKEKEFTLQHAQNIFDLQKKNPPASWKLTDEKYQLTNGKIERKPNISPTQGSQK